MSPKVMEMVMGAGGKRVCYSHKWANIRAERKGIFYTAARCIHDVPMDKPCGKCASWAERKGYC